VDDLVTVEMNVYVLLTSALRRCEDV